MINSMTAFARAEKSIETLTVIMEIRAYNSKNLDIAVRMPSGYQPLEEKIKGTVARQVMRGRIEINCQLTQGTKDADGFEIDTEKARAYHRALIRLKDELGLAGDISLDHLTAGGNIIRPAEKTSDMDSDWPVIQACLETVLGELCAMRRAEGANLAADLTSRLELIENRLESIEAATDGLLDRYRDRLTERIQALTKGLWKSIPPESLRRPPCWPIEAIFQRRSFAPEATSSSSGRSCPKRRPADGNSIFSFRNLTGNLIPWAPRPETRPSRTRLSK